MHTCTISLQHIPAPAFTPICRSNVRLPGSSGCLHCLFQSVPKKRRVVLMRVCVCCCALCETYAHISISLSVNYTFRLFTSTSYGMEVSV